jgi:hypothetical protein
MMYESALVIFIAAFCYWLGCKRTKIKLELISLMTPVQYRCFTEIKLCIAKSIIILLITLIFWMKHNA